jgi:hypothetical protein
MAETHKLSEEEKSPPSQHLEAVLKDEERHDRPVYGIDEAHQKKVMYCPVHFLSENLSDYSTVGGGSIFVSYPS